MVITLWQIMIKNSIRRSQENLCSVMCMICGIEREASAVQVPKKRLQEKGNLNYRERYDNVNNNTNSGVQAFEETSKSYSFADVSDTAVFCLYSQLLYLYTAEGTEYCFEKDLNRGKT